MAGKVDNYVVNFVSNFTFTNRKRVRAGTFGLSI